MGNSGLSKSKEIDNKLRLASKTRVLNLSDSHLRTNSSVWSKIQNSELALKTLDCSANILNEGIPASILTVLSLKSLYLSNCNLTIIPDLTALRNLNNLRIDHNKLESSAISLLPDSLISLDLSFNSLVCIPDSLSRLKSVSDINLSNNQIVFLTGIGSMIALISLNLDNNEITEIPDESSQLVSLKTLSLKNNNITAKRLLNDSQSIPSSLFTLTELQSLNLEGNVQLTNKVLMDYEGVESFMERRQRLKQKNLQGGAINDFSVFGLP